MRRPREVWPLVRRVLARSAGFIAAFWRGARGRWVEMRVQSLRATPAAQVLRRQYALGTIGREAFERSLALLKRRRR